MDNLILGRKNSICIVLQSIITRPSITLSRNKLVWWDLFNSNSSDIFLLSEWLVLEWLFKFFFRSVFDHYGNVTLCDFELRQGYEFKIDQAEHFFILLHKVYLFEEKCLVDVWKDVVREQVCVIF